MQTMAAYLLESGEKVQWPEVRQKVFSETRTLVLKWLATEKRADVSQSTGEYKTGGRDKANFEIRDVQHEDERWWMLRMKETTATGRAISVGLSITKTISSVSVYCNIKAGFDGPGIKPVQSDVRCPKVVRSIVNGCHSWLCGGARLEGLTAIDSFEGGTALAHELTADHRRLPFIVVADRPRSAVDGLAGALEYDLTGTARVFSIDADAAWALTDRFGSRYGCFGGAARIYWPGFSTTDDPFRHQLWSGPKLEELQSRLGAKRTLTKFRSQVRRLVLGTSALSIERPQATDRIRSSAKRAELSRLRAAAQSTDDYEFLADAFSEDNARLESIVGRQKSEIADLQRELERAVSKCQALQYQVKAKTLPSDDELQPDVPDEFEEPSAGETRFYKKVYSHSRRDVMKVRADCGCNNWESARKADKAMKGIAKLEGRRDWKKIQHCASCTGGGMWRVTW